jgi:hypothetical protein
MALPFTPAPSSFLLTLVIVLASLAGCARIPYVSMRHDPAPVVTISVLKLSPPSVYESTQSDETVLLPTGQSFSAWVKAEGKNGVGLLSLQATVDGVLTATATVQDHIDSQGKVAASLLILGVDGNGNPGNMPISLKISQGQSASITARATAPDLTPTQVVLKLLSTCPCPLGSIFDKHCDCGCGTQPDLALPAQYSEGPFLPLCGTTCCKMGEQCQQPQNMCGLSSPPAGARLFKP